MNRITIEKYDPQWNISYASEKLNIENALKHEFKGIMHIGSTSIIGMDAKPIIDIAVGLNSFSELKFHESILNNIGYCYINGLKMDNWYLFDKISEGKEYHLHLMPANSFRLFNQVLFKIFLEENKEYATQYVLLKKFYVENDAQIFYSMNKEPFVSKINKLALREWLHNLALWEKKISKVMGYYPKISDLN